jgi:hypothetical protein
MREAATNTIGRKAIETFPEFSLRENGRVELYSEHLERIRLYVPSPPPCLEPKAAGQVGFPGRRSLVEHGTGKVGQTARDSDKVLTYFTPLKLALSSLRHP